VFHVFGKNQLVVVELKAKSAVHPIDKAQTLSHLRLMNRRYGLLINFHEERLVDGVSRIVNGYGSPAGRS
jgi:GxxExxY protein